jgi:glycerophosphoryl diester phosphodiesterase
LIFTIPEGEFPDGMPCDRCLKRDYKQRVDFTKTYATGISPWKPFIIPTKELTQIIMASQRISIRMEK